jgi:hypothetical protein
VIQKGIFFRYFGRRRGYDVRNFVLTELNTWRLLKLGGNFVLCNSLPFACSVGSVIDSGIGLSITIDYVRGVYQ